MAESEEEVFTFGRVSVSCIDQDFFIVAGLSLDPRWISAGSRLDLRWILAGSRLDLRWILAGSRLVPRWILAGSRLDPGWILHFWGQKCSKKCHSFDLFLFKNQ